MCLFESVDEKLYWRCWNDGGSRTAFIRDGNSKGRSARNRNVGCDSSIRLRTDDSIATSGNFLARGTTYLEC
jgi:hypothetical protein